MGLSEMQERARRYLDAKWGPEQWQWEDEPGSWEGMPQRSMDFNFVAADLVVGSAIANAAGVDQLKAIGITDVICCAQEWNAIDAQLLAGAGINLLAIGQNDDLMPKPASWFKTGIEFAGKVKGRLYVHCNMGINRAPAMAYAILRSRGLSVAEAETSMLARPRPQAFGTTNPYFDSADAAMK